MRKSPDMSPFKIQNEESNLLIIHPGAMGDVLLSIPAIRALRQAAPSMKVGLLANGQIAELLVACGEIHQFFSLDRSGFSCLLSGQTNGISPALRAFMEKGISVVGWMKDDDGKIAAQFKGMGIHNCVVCSPHSSEVQGTHQSIRFLHGTGFDRMSPLESWELQLPQATQKQGKELLHTKLLKQEGPPVCIHPGSGSPHKCFRPSLFAELVKDLQKQGAFPVLLQGPADAKQVMAVRDACANPPPIIHDVSIPQLAGILSAMNLFVGHDSGATHLAAALSVKTIALFGPTDPQQWAPLGPKVHVLSGPTCHCKEWDQVRSCQEKSCLGINSDLLRESCLSFLESSQARHSLKEDKHLSCPV